MTSLADTDFVPMRLGKVVAVGDEDGSSFCVVLEGMTGDPRLPIWIGQTEGFNLSAGLDRGGVRPTDEPSVHRRAVARSRWPYPAGAD